MNVVSPGFLAALRIPLRAGRPIDDGDRSGAPPVAVLGESAARLLEGGAFGTWESGWRWERRRGG